jgi:hypothetical protein
MTGYSSTKDKCDTVLTVDMVDVVGAYLRVVCLFPAQGQFVSDAISKRLWFRKPATNTKYLQNNFRSLPSMRTNGNLRITSISTTQKKNTGSFHKLSNLWSGQEFLSYRKKNVFTAVNKINILRCAQHTTLLNLLTNIHLSYVHTHRLHALGSQRMHEYVSILGIIGGAIRK